MAAAEGEGEEKDISWWRKYTRLGDEYQASTLPPCAPSAPQPGDTASCLVWEPSGVPTDKGLTEYLETCESHVPFRGSRWLKNGPKTSKKRPRDDEPAPPEEAALPANPWLPQVAYDALHASSYDFNAAQDSVRGFSDVRQWTDDEKGAFSRAIAVHGKDFKRVALIIGTKTIRETINYFFTWWRCSPEHVVWKKARDSRRGGKGKKTGIPRNADIVLAVRGKIDIEDGKVKLTCKFFDNDETPIVYELEGAVEPPPEQQQAASCSTPGRAALNACSSPRAVLSPRAGSTAVAAAAQPEQQSAQNATAGATGVQPAAWPPSGTYCAQVVHNGELITEKVA